MKVAIRQAPWLRAEGVETDGVASNEVGTRDLSLGGVSVRCLQEAGERYRCSGIPAQINCQLPVLNGSGSMTGWSSAEGIQIKDTSHLQAQEGQAGVLLLIPRGQTVAYRRAAGWGRLKPEELATDSWVRFVWDPYGNCTLSK